MIERKTSKITLEPTRVTADAPSENVDINGIIRGIVVVAPALTAGSCGVVVKGQRGEQLFTKSSITKAATTAILIDANNHPLSIPISINGVSPIRVTTPDTTESEADLTSDTDIPIADGDLVTIGTIIYRFKDTLAQAYDVLIEPAVAANGTVTSTADGAPANGGTITIGSKTYTFVTNITGAFATAVLTSDTTNPDPGDQVTVGTKTYTLVSGFTEAYATGTITLFENGNPGDGGIITIGDKTYTFKNTLTAVANQIKIGVDGETTLNNLRAALSGAAGSGTKYSTGTTSNAQANAPLVAAVDTDATLGISALALGTAGNSIAFTEDTAENLTIDGSGFLTGGLASVANEVLIGANTDATLTNLAAAINGSAGEGTTYSTGTTANGLATSSAVVANAITLTAVSIGVSGNSIAKVEDSAHLDFDGVGAVFTGGVDPIANEVKIGASGQATLNNLRAALSAGAGAGTAYGIGTVANTQANAPSVAVFNDPDYDLVVQAVVAGDGGNSVIFTENATNTTVSGAGVLSGGDSLADNTMTNLADAIKREDGGGEAGSKYHAGTVAHPYVEPSGDASAGVLTINVKDESIVDGADIALSETSSSLSWGTETLDGGGEAIAREFEVDLLVEK